MITDKTNAIEIKQERMGTLCHHLWNSILDMLTVFNDPLKKKERNEYWKGIQKTINSLKLLIKNY